MAGLFTKAPKPPKIPETAPMPDPEDPDVLARKRRDAAKKSQKSGRSASLLGDQHAGDKLGA